MDVWFWVWVLYALLCGSTLAWAVLSIRQARRFNARLRQLNTDLKAAGGWEAMSPEQRRAWIADIDDLLKTKRAGRVS